MRIEFRGKVWHWRGPAPFYFVTVPDDDSREPGRLPFLHVRTDAWEELDIGFHTRSPFRRKAGRRS